PTRLVSSVPLLMAPAPSVTKLPPMATAPDESKPFTRNAKLPFMTDSSPAGQAWRLPVMLMTSVADLDVSSTAVAVRVGVLLGGAGCVAGGVYWMLGGLFTCIAIVPQVGEQLVSGVPDWSFQVTPPLGVVSLVTVAFTVTSVAPGAML